jgi:hypothetical protein
MVLSHRDFWDTRHVKSELATGAMSEAKVFLYFLAITTFDWLQLTVFRIRPTQRRFRSQRSSKLGLPLASLWLGSYFFFFAMEEAEARTSSIDISPLR